MWPELSARLGYLEALHLSLSGREKLKERGLGWQREMTKKGRKERQRLETLREMEQKEEAEESSFPESCMIYELNERGAGQE